MASNGRADNPSLLNRGDLAVGPHEVGAGLRDELGTFAMNQPNPHDHGAGRNRHAGPEMPAGQTGHARATGSHAAHERHAEHSVAMFRDKFWLSLALTIPVLISVPSPTLPFRF